MLKINLKKYKDILKTNYKEPISEIKIGQLIEISYKISLTNDFIYTFSGKCINITKRNLDSTITLLSKFEKSIVIMVFPKYSSIIKSIKIIKT